MPAVVTHTAIMLLAKARIEDLRSVLDARIRRYATGQKPLIIEKRLRDLAQQALDNFAAPPLAAPDVLGGAPLGSNVSKLAVMGAMGPDIPAFANVLQPGQPWVFDSVHKGTPDEDRERVIARTTDLALEIWAQAVPKIRAQLANDKQDEALRRVRAYVQGHLCHLAGDIVSHPFINDIEWHLGTSAQSKLEHADGEASHDAASAQRIYGRGGLRDGPNWENAWPKTEGEVPEQLFAAYAEALEQVLKAKTNRPKGLAQFEHVLVQLDPPNLEDAFIRDGYEVLKGGIVRHVYGHGAPGWALLLTPVMLPVIALPFLALILPGLRFLPLAGSDDDKERQAFETVAHALYPASLSALIYQLLFMSITTRGVVARQVSSLLGIIANLVIAVLFYAESGRKAWSPGARWTALFVVPLLMNLVFLTISLIERGRKTDGGGYPLTQKGYDHKRRAAATLLPALFSLGVWLLWFVFLIPVGISAGIGGLVELIANGTFNPVTPVFWVSAGLWVILSIVVWVLLSYKLRDIQFHETPDLFAARKRHAVRLFDEEALFLEAGSGADRPLDFPSGRRDLARLWWTGEGTMSIRSDRYGLAFRLNRGGADLPVQLVPAPVAPMTLSEYLTFLGATVQDHAGATGKLQSRALFADQDYDLPAGAVFSAHGDTAETEEAVALGAARFEPLNDTDNADAYVLRHAQKVWQSVRLGPLGPVPRPSLEREGEIGGIETANGYAYVHDHKAALAQNRIDSDSLMSIAGDFGALLCLGAVPHLGGKDDERIFQVFRNWCLDRRRVNEWRMIVAGRAWSEKAAPDRYDEKMPHGARGPTDPAAWRAPIGAAAAAEAEQTALGAGWVPAFRKWLDMMRQPAQDPNAATSIHPEDPTNRALSRAVAWLLDFPEPATRAS